MSSAAAAGTYRISVSVAGTVLRGRDIDLGDAARSATLRRRRTSPFTTTASVTGRVVDAAGRPVAGLTLELGPAGAGCRTANGYRSRRPLRAGADSVRAFRAERAGGSVARRRGHGRRASSIPASRPPAAATRVALAAGRTTRPCGLQASRRVRPTSRCPGSCSMRTARRPRARASISRASARDDRIVSEPVAVDFVGRFVIAARAGTDYLLFAERARPGGRSSRVDSTDQLRLTAVDGLKPVRLTLARRY